MRAHPGVTAEGIRAHCFGDTATIKTVHVNICQINDLLAGTDVKIKSDINRGGRTNREPGGYRIVRKKRRPN